MSKKQVVYMPCNTWFECYNCHEKYFNSEGKYEVLDLILCEDCMIEGDDNSFEAKTMNIDF